MKFVKKPITIDAEQFHPEVTPWPEGVRDDPTSPTGYSIGTLESKEGHEVTPGDWIITGIKGEKYPCKPDIFAASYEPAIEERQSTASVVD